jgi:hypothetical protein
MKRGQAIRIIYTGPGPGVHAWDLPKALDPRNVDIIKYRELLLRAVLEVLQPLGVTEAILKDWLFSRAGYLAPPGLLGSSDAISLALPLLAGVQHLRLDPY